MIGVERSEAIEFCVRSLTGERWLEGAVSSTPPIELAMLEVDPRRARKRETSCWLKLNLEDRTLGEVAPGDSGDSAAK